MRPGLVRIVAYAIAAAATALSARACQAATPAVAESLFVALFDTFVATESLAIPDSTRALLLEARTGIWAQWSRSPALVAALEPFADLGSVAGASPRVQDLVERRGLRRFDRLAEMDRVEVLAALLQSDDNGARQMVTGIRTRILGATYGSRFGAAIAGIQAPSRTRSDLTAFLADHTPRFPRSWLVLDRDAREVRPRQGRIDVLVVGSGPAGCVVAHELGRAGYRVVIVEQGSLIVPGTMQTRALPAMLESFGLRTSRSGSVLFSNAEAVGGGTAVNIDLAFPPTHPSVRRQIERWRSERRITRDLFTPSAMAKANEWVTATIGTRAASEGEVNANNRVLWDGAHRHGLHPKLYDLNTWPPGQWASPVTDKRSAVSQLLFPAMQNARSPVALLSDASALRILFGSGRGGRVARGIELVMRPPWNGPGVIADPAGLGTRPGDTLIVRADRVILCAGALGSAALLLRSHLDNLNIGRGIVVHPAVPVIGEFDRTIDALVGTPASVFVDDFALSRGFFLEAMSAGPEYAAVMTPGDGRQVFQAVSAYRRLAGFGVMLIDSSSASNRIEIDESGRPMIWYELSDADRARLRAAVAEAIRIMFEAGVRRVILPTTESLFGHGGPGTTVASLTDVSQADSVARGLELIPNRTLMTSAHLQASCQMGTDPRTSVVSPHHVVWGTERLYVVDASVFPGSVGANPMQSVYAIAKLFADRFVLDLNAERRKVVSRRATPRANGRPRPPGARPTRSIRRGSRHRGRAREPSTTATTLRH